MSEKSRYILLAILFSVIAVVAVGSFIAVRINLTTLGLTAVILGVPLVRLIRYLIGEYRKEK